MFHSFRITRLTTTCVLVASMLGVGTAVAGVSLTFKNSGKLKISVKVDKIGYRNDIDKGRSDTVPAARLQNVDPKDDGIVWEAYPADLKSVAQKQPNGKCDGGKIKFDAKGAATIDVKGNC